MDSTEDVKRNYPPEYHHVGEMVHEAQERIRQIDEQIKNAPSDKGPEPQYNPPGFMRSRQSGSREQTINSLNEQKELIKAEVMARVHKETALADPATARTVRDNAREEMYPNPFIGKDEAQIAKISSQTKDIEKSQNFADAQLSGRSKADQKEKDTAAPAKAESKPLSMSARFFQSFSIPTETEKASNAPDKSRDSGKSKNDMDKD